MSRTLVISLGVLLLFLAAGFVIPYATGGSAPQGTFCTLMACMCGEREGEIPCNSCGESTTIFQTWIMDVSRECGGREILVCRQGAVEYESRRVEIDQDSCTYRVSLFSQPIEYLFSNPSRTVESETVSSPVLEPNTPVQE